MPGVLTCAAAQERGRASEADRNTFAMDAERVVRRCGSAACNGRF